MAGDHRLEATAYRIMPHVLVLAAEWGCHHVLAPRKQRAHLPKTCIRQATGQHRPDRTKSPVTTTVPLQTPLIEDSSSGRLLTTTSTTTTTDEGVEITERRSSGVLGSLAWPALTRAHHSISSRPLCKVRLASHKG